MMCTLRFFRIILMAPAIIFLIFATSHVNYAATDKSSDADKALTKKSASKILNEWFPGCAVQSVVVADSVAGKIKYQARFSFKGKEGKAEFDENGRLRQTQEFVIPNEDLPESAMLTLKQNFPFAEITGVRVWFHFDVLIHYVQLQYQNRSYDLELHNSQLFRIVDLKILNATDALVFPPVQRPFLKVVKAFADTMIDYGIDKYGTKRGGLFVSLLDRNSLKPFDLQSLPLPPVGISTQERLLPLASNLRDEIELLLLFQSLADFTGDHKYQLSIDASIRFMLTNCTFPYSGLFCWGDQVYYDLLNDCIVGDNEVFETFWPFWDRAFFINREAMVKMANGLWQVSLRNKETGANSSQNRGHSSRNIINFDVSSWNISYMMDLWSRTYQKTSNKAFLKYIELLLPELEKRTHSKFKFYKSQPGNERNLLVHPGCPYLWETSNRVPEPLSARIKKLCTDADSVFVLLPHDIAQKGLIAFIELGDDGAKYHFSGTNMWQTGSSIARTATSMAAFGNIIQQRLLQLPKGQIRTRMEQLVVQIADLYQSNTLSFDRPVLAFSMADAILLQLNAYQLTQNSRYLDQARKFGEVAVNVFWGQKGLPAASNIDRHYESLAGGPKLARALMQTHVALQ